MAPHQSQHNIKSQYENMRQHHSQSSFPLFLNPDKYRQKLYHLTHIQIQTPI